LLFVNITLRNIFIFSKLAQHLSSCANRLQRIYAICSDSQAAQCFVKLYNLQNFPQSVLSAAMGVIYEK